MTSELTCSVKDPSACNAASQWFDMCVPGAASDPRSDRLLSQRERIVVVEAWALFILACDKMSMCACKAVRDQFKTGLYHDLKRLQLISFLMETNVSKPFRLAEPRRQYG